MYYETKKTLLRKARHPETQETSLTFINPLIFNYYGKDKKTSRTKKPRKA